MKVKFGGRRAVRKMFLEAACLFVLSTCAACASTGQRPFYLFGHMANSLADVDDFVNQGANAIEADLRFSSVGIPQLFYHGALCDCGRHCEKSAGVPEYLSYLSDAVKDGGKFAGKLQLLYIDIKAANIPWGTKYQAGINLATDLIRYLWKNGTVPPEFMLNVILSMSTTLNKDILWGARDTLQRAASSSLFMDHVGFDISGYELLDIIAATYEELGIRQHRWQGDGTSNCLIDGYWDVRTKAVISRRTATNLSRDYVDKAYVWTVDRPKSVRRFLRFNIDGMMTNAPATVLNILQEPEFITRTRESCDPCCKGDDTQ